MIFVAFKIILDAIATISFIVGRQWGMALMFAGFTIADFGALWVAL